MSSVLEKGLSTFEAQPFVYFSHEPSFYACLKSNVFSTSSQGLRPNFLCKLLWNQFLKWDKGRIHFCLRLLETNLILMDLTSFVLNINSFLSCWRLSTIQFLGLFSLFPHFFAVCKWFQLINHKILCQKLLYFFQKQCNFFFLVFLSSLVRCTSLCIILLLRVFPCKDQILL